VRRPDRLLPRAERRGGREGASLPKGFLDFGVRPPGATSPAQIVSLKNSGGKPLTVTGRVEVSTAEFVIVEDDCGNSVLLPGAACEVHVAFRPSSVGAKSAVLTANAPGCAGGTIQAALSGVGAAVDSSLLPIDFGAHDVGSESAGITRTIFNTESSFTGSFTVAIEGQHAGQFRINANTCSGPLAPGQSCDITLAFHPTTVGGKTSVTACVAPSGR